MIKGGLFLEKFRTGHLMDKQIPKALRYLNHYAIGNVLEALKHPEKPPGSICYSGGDPAVF